ncbi:MAG: HPF/RaiA family ribosome-associated protein [Verrucomicrobiota bacterium]
MLVQVSGQGFELSAELREYVEEKLAAALARFSPRIATAKAFLADENGRKHGLDKSIRLVIDAERLPLIVVEEQGESWHSVIAKSVERAAHAISRQSDRIRSRINRTSMAGDIETSLERSLGANLA